MSELETKKKQLEARKKELETKKSIISGETKMKRVKSPLLSKFRVSTIDELLGTTSVKSINKNENEGCKGVNVADRSLSYISVEDRETVKALKEATDIAIMESMVFGKSVKETQTYIKQIAPMVKDFGIGSGDEGFEWIPTGVSTSYIDEFNLERKVASLFQEIRMPTNPYKFPVLTNGAIATKLGVAVSKSPKDVFSTDETITFDAIKMSNQYLLPEELSEDSAVNVLQVIRQELVEGASKAIEIAIINGDLDALHQDANSIFGTAVAPASDSSERFWDGLRKRALQGGLTVDAGADAMTSDDVTEMRKQMGKFAVNPADLALIVSPSVYFGIQQDPDVTTLEKYGQAATILTGELGRIQGIPMVVSEYMREDMDLTGVNVLVADALSGAILVHRKRFFLGLRRALQIRIERNKTDLDALDMVSYARYAFQATLKADGANAADQPTVSYLVNVG